MSEEPRTRALIVVFDALRPEFVTPEIMPNLHAFSRDGVHYSNSRSTFPSETRVNQSAVITGCYPSRHGIVANNFLFGEGSGRGVLTTGDDVAFQAALERMGGPLFGMPTLAERLHAAGLSFATISSGTSGGGRLINLGAEERGSFRLAMRRPEAACPEGVFDEISAGIGPLPEYTRPAIAWNSYAVECYLRYVEPRLKPDVMLLWLCDPDETFHFLGIGSEPSLQAIRHVDAELGRVLAHHEAEISAGRMHVIALSDHGQVALEGLPLKLSEKLQAGGFDVDRDMDIAVANAGGIWLEDPDPSRIARLVEWLREQDWCGPLFTSDESGGTLALQELGLDHPRAPHIALVLRCRDEANEWGRMGVSLHDSPYPDGGGSHGGLSSYEMHNFLAMSGKRFRSGCGVAAPAGNIDILPTLMQLLGVGIEETIDGRVLAESFSDGPEPGTLEWEEKTLVSANATGAKTHLSLTMMGASRYINRAWSS